MKLFNTILVLRIISLFVFFAIFCFPQRMAALELKVILRADSPASTVDNLPDGEREQVIRDIRAKLSAGPKPKEFLDFLALTCAIQPWTTGNEKDDVAFQGELAAVMVAESSPHTDLFRNADCATFNRQGSYRAYSSAPLFNLRQEWCNRAGNQADAARTLDAQYIARMNEVISAVEAFNSTSDALISKAATDAGRKQNDVGYSYYPLRNQLRLSMLEAARAVELAWAGDMSQAQIQFSKTAKRLHDFRTSLDTTQRRNNWRFVEDLEYYAALYAWLGGESDHLDLDALIDAQPVGQNASGLVPPATVKDIRDRTNGKVPYLDFIYMERLLPGLQRRQSECRAWRARSYNVVALAKFTQNCSTKPIKSYDNLLDFDLCMADFEATDWTIQILSVSIGKNRGKSAQDRAVKQAQTFTDNITVLVEGSDSQADSPSCRIKREDLKGTQIGFMEHIKRKFRVENRNGHVVVYLAGTFCTTEVEWFRHNLKAIVGPLPNDPLFRRPRIR